MRTLRFTLAALGIVLLAAAPSTEAAAAQHSWVDADGKWHSTNSGVGARIGQGHPATIVSRGHVPAYRPPVPSRSVSQRPKVFHGYAEPDPPRWPRRNRGFVWGGGPPVRPSVNLVPPLK